MEDMTQRTLDLLAQYGMNNAHEHIRRLCADGYEVIDCSVHYTLSRKYMRDITDMHVDMTVINLKTLVRAYIRV